MKAPRRLLEQIANPDNLRLAFWKARIGKSNGTNVNAYRAELAQNLLRLREQILSGDVVIGDYRFFKIYDPKERQICAAAFSEQVLHHALMNVCHPLFERVQIFDSYASRKGKGTYAAIDRARKYTNQHAFFLKLDVRKFFDSIHHQTLKTQLAHVIGDGKVLWILYQIIDSYHTQPGRGVPIGNLTSQYFANHFMAGLDHFIKTELGIKAYVRYMDDFVLWHEEKQALVNALSAIQTYVQQTLFCTLKTPQLNQTSRGLPFLGYVVYPHHLRLSQRSKQRFILKLRNIEAHYESGEWTEAQCQSHVLPLLAFVQHANLGRFLPGLKLK